MEETNMKPADERAPTRSTEIVLETFRAVEHRDLERLLSLYHPDVELVWPESLPYGGTFRGSESPPPGRTWDDTWDPLQPTGAERRMDPRVVAAAGDDVVVLYHQRGVSGTGRRLDQDVLGWYTVDGGKFARAQMFYFDTVALTAFLADA
jgi:ketosteroid isomerase-like protein